MTDSTPNLPPPEGAASSSPPGSYSTPLPPPPVPPLPTFPASTTPAFPAPPKPPAPAPGAMPIPPAFAPPPLPPSFPSSATPAFPRPPMPGDSGAQRTPAFPSSPAVPKPPAFPSAAAPPPPPPSFPGAGGAGNASPPPPPMSSGDTAWMMQYAAPMKKAESMPGTRSAAERAAALDLSGAAVGNTDNLPWEDATSDFLTAYLGTIWAILSSPGKFFSSMPTDFGHWQPLKLAITSAFISSIITFLLQIALRQMAAGSSFAGLDAQTRAAANMGEGVGFLMAAGCVAVCVPPIVIVGMYLISAILHLPLLVLGGAEQGFEATLRVVCYTYGACVLPMSIPLAGCLFWLYYVALIGIGLCLTQRCAAWKAVLATLFPVLLCCGLAGVPFMSGFMRARAEAQAAGGNVWP